jgi:N-acetylmuramoyl-L-alanine amidase
MSKKDIQKALKNAGYYDGPVDGKIGPKTRAAIKAFQGDKGLKEDGIPGSQTKEKLAKYLS